MGMLRGFTPVCDVPDCHDMADWAETWSWLALERALGEGWHVRRGWMICEFHWDQGWRFNALGQ